MSRCCFMLFELTVGVRGLGVFFLLVNLLLLVPLLDGYQQLAFDSVDGTVPSPPDASTLAELYARHRRILLTLATAAIALSILVNTLLVLAVTPSPGRSRLLLLPWLVWYALLFVAASAAVPAAVVQWLRGRLVLEVPEVLLGVGLLPLLWYWFAAVVILFTRWPRPPARTDRSRHSTAASGDSGGGDSGVVQATLSRAVWYWAALHAAVMDEQERQTSRPQQQQQEEKQSTNGSTSAEPLVRHQLSSIAELDPAQSEGGEEEEPGGV